MVFKDTAVAKREPSSLEDTNWTVKGDRSENKRIDRNPGLAFNQIRTEQAKMQSKPTLRDSELSYRQADELIPTRATLLQRLKNWQDQSSWQDFFDTYWKLIYQVALKGGLCEAEAQDVVQETLISVAKHMPTFNYDPAIGTFKTWLLNMTRWRIIDQLRKRGPAAECSLFSHDTSTAPRTVDQVIDPSSQDLDAVWDAEWKRNLVDAAIAKVKRRFDPQNYQIFDLYVNKEWEPAKVAAAFGVSVGQVYLAKHRVIETISEEVKRLEMEIS